MVCHLTVYCSYSPFNDSYYQKKDTSQLYNYALETRAALVQKTRPLLIQQTSPLSELQLLVKRARKTMVDPILARFEQMSSPEPSSSEEELDPEEVKRRQERERIRQLKNKKIYASSLSLPTSSTLSLKPQGTEGVFIRRDIDDETMEVDIDIGDGLEGSEKKIDGGLLSLAPAIDTKLGIRIRRPTIKKAQSQHSSGAGNTKDTTTTQNSHRSPKKSQPKSSLMAVALRPPPDPQSSDEDTTLPENPPENLNSKRKSKDPKPKPETYKQSWSVSEQNLLEQLLEEIPDGEKFRHVFFCILS